MKRKLHIIILVLCCCNFTKISIAKPLQILSVYVQESTNDWCNNPTGSLIATVNGGVAPFSYLWSNGATSDQVNFLFSGQYAVTVTDAVGTTATAIGFVNILPAPEFYVNAIEMTRMGLNNGSVTVSLYPGGSVQYLPYGVYYFDLLDSTGGILENYTQSVPSAFNPTHTFDSLPAGHYSVQLTTSFAFSCYTYADFRIKEMPMVYPTYTTLPSCNGSPTGQILINTHPNPALNANTFSSNHTSNLVVTEKVTSKYKVIIYDSLNVIKGYYQTQDSAIVLNGLSTGNYKLKIYAGDTVGTFNPGVHDSLLFYSGNFTILDDTLCSLVKGRLFADYNNDCIYNSGDIKQSGTLMELNPGGYSFVTNSNGEFYIPAPVGVYTLKQYTPYQYAQYCPDTSTFSVNVTTPGMIIDIQVADSIDADPDVQLGLYAGTARPGFNQYYQLGYKNITPNNVAAQVITFDFDSNLTFVSSSLPYASITNNQITWNVGALGPFGQRNFNVVLNIPSTTTLGTIINADANVSAAAGENNLSNNYDAVTTTVTGSFDPNDITVDPIGFEAQGYIADFQNLKYTIRFQNTGTDTAFTITVTDTLPLFLDKYSLSVLDASHNYWYEFKNSNQVLFHFENILLPDSNINEEGSHGFIKFSINQKQGNAPGTIILNSAAIYFDFNAPVITNVVSNTVFDCANIASVSYSSNTICEGDSITGTPTLLFDMNTEWYLDGNLYSTDSIVNLSNLNAGNYTVDFIATNSVCDQQISNAILLNALPAQPVINFIADSLYISAAAGIQWYLNGSVINGATNASYHPVVNGWYAVSVTDINGCSSFSDSIQVLNTATNNSFNLSTIQLIPNPATAQFEISGVSFTVNDVVIISDAFGKTVYQVKILQPTLSLKIQTANFSSGIYFVMVKNAEAKVTLKLIKL